MHFCPEELALIFSLMRGDTWQALVFWAHRITRWLTPGKK
jgi:hypothetical protein